MPDSGPPPRITRREALTVAVATAAAAAARFAFLDRTPPGLHVDEAFNLLDARAVIAGWRPLFLPANAGRDVLYTYLQAVLLAVFGDRLAVARAASALVGTLTVPLVWWMVRTITPGGGVPAVFGSDVEDGVNEVGGATVAGARRTRCTAIVAAALLAVSFWHLHFSRFGIRAILLPAFVAVLLARWWPAATAGEPRRRRRAAFDAGIVLGLAAYAHPAGRGLVALPAAHALWRAARRRDAARWRELGIAAAVGTFVALPLVVQWLAHPWQATGHAAEVSILGLGPAEVLRNAARVAGLFNVAGDTALWRNVPGRPAFDVVAGAAFLVGAALAIREAWRGRDWAIVALVTLVGLALPSVLTDGAPNFSRAIGVLPVAVWLAAVGVVAVGQAVGDIVARRTAPVWRVRIAVLLPAVVLGWAAIATGRDYAAWADDPATRLAFDADIEAFARWLDGLPAQPAVFTSPLTADHATYRAEAERPAPGVDARHGLVVPAPPGGDGRGEARYVDVGRLPWAAEQADALAGWSAARLPDIRLSTRLGALAAPPADVGPLVGAVVNIDVRRARRSASRPARWDEAITFLDVALPQRIAAGSEVTATIAWAADGPTGHSLSTAVQLNTVSGQAVANGDGLPAGGSYPTDRWRPGEVVLSRHRLTVPAGAPAGPAVLRLGWYVLTYPDGPAGPPHVNPITDDDGRPTVDVAFTVVTAPEPPPDGG